MKEICCRKAASLECLGCNFSTMLKALSCCFLTQVFSWYSELCSISLLVREIDFYNKVFLQRNSVYLQRNLHSVLLLWTYEDQISSSLPHIFQAVLHSDFHLGSSAFSFPTQLQTWVFGVMAPPSCHSSLWPWIKDAHICRQSVCWSMRLSCALALPSCHLAL